MFMSPKVRNTKKTFIKAYMSRGERRRTERNLCSRNTRTAGSRVSAWKQSVQRSLKSLLPRTKITLDDTRRSNESNACTTKNDLRSTNPKQLSAPAEKLTSTNPHLADGDSMKDVEGNNTIK